VVENRPGGNDVVGLTSVLQARADGHTLLCGYCGTMTGRVAVGTLGNILPARDFIPIGQITDTPQLSSRILRCRLIPCVNSSPMPSKGRVI